MLFSAQKLREFENYLQSLSLEKNFLLGHILSQQNECLVPQPLTEDTEIGDLEASKAPVSKRGPSRESFRADALLLWMHAHC